MTNERVRRAASILGKAAGGGAVKRRGDAAYYAKLRLSRPGTVTVEDIRSAANWLRDGVDLHDRVAAWLEREADRRQRLNEERARKRGR